MYSHLTRILTAALIQPALCSEGVVEQEHVGDPETGAVDGGIQPETEAYNCRSWEQEKWGNSDCTPIIRNALKMINKQKKKKWIFFFFYEVTVFAFIETKSD